jgi:uncharacterized membrane protein (DUF2068 family)
MTAIGVRLIVAYKLVKAALGLALAVVFAAVVLGGGAEGLHAFALGLRQHVVSAWSIRVANLLVTATTRGHLELTAVALGLDGLLTLIEGWSLRRGYAWAPWLVVIATGSLIPFELGALLREVRLGRAVILLVNIVILVYLVRRVLRERAAARPGSGHNLR